MEGPIMKKLGGKVALVTGSGRGLGEGIALAMAGAGMNLVINDVIEENANAVAKKIRDLKQEAIVCPVDITHSGNVKAMIRQAMDKFGRIDVLVNNAGISPKKEGSKIPFYEIEDKQWDLVFAVNLTGAFYCIREVAKEMMKVRSGCIVNIASNAGKTGGMPSQPSGAHYSVSKAGLICLTKSAARELAPFNVRVNAVAPGPIITPMMKTSSQKANEAQLKEIPLGRFAKIEEIVNAVLFLASDESSYITGTTLDVNGGWPMN
jgi:NAD(P)-dependent dehydrogenase (short-subunit alcohol dehydrogenase family)